MLARVSACKHTCVSVCAFVVAACLFLLGVLCELSVHFGCGRAMLREQKLKRACMSVMGCAHVCMPVCRQVQCGCVLVGSWAVYVYVCLRVCVCGSVLLMQARACADSRTYVCVMSVCFASQVKWLGRPCALAAQAERVSDCGGVCADEGQHTHTPASWTCCPALPLTQARLRSSPSAATSPAPSLKYGVRPRRTEISTHT